MNLTKEVLEIFDDSEINIKKVLRELATCFGADASIHDVAIAFESYKSPKKSIGGGLFSAGYGGSNMLKEGQYTGVLADITQYGKSAKLLFTIDDKYLYQTLKEAEFEVKDIVKYTKSLNQEFTVFIAHESIPSTGEKHAVIYDSISVDDIKPLGAI